MLSKTIVIGRVGRDPEMRYTANGNPVTNLSLAVEHGYGENAKTVWYRVTFWGRTAEVVNEYVVKGDLIYAEGTINEPRIWMGRDGTAHCDLELTAYQVKFLSSKRDRQERQSNNNGQRAQVQAPEVAKEEIPW